MKDNYFYTIFSHQLPLYLPIIGPQLAFFIFNKPLSPHVHKCISVRQFTEAQEANQKPYHQD